MTLLFILDALKFIYKCPSLSETKKETLIVLESPHQKNLEFLCEMAVIAAGVVVWRQKGGGGGVLALVINGGGSVAHACRPISK